MRAEGLTLSGEPDAAARGRAYLRSALALAPEDLRADAELVATELITNAQLHGLLPISVHASWSEPSVLVEVEDASHRMPVQPTRSAESLTGRGLRLVAAISSSWGVRPATAGAGKVVWAELGGSAAEAEVGLDIEALLAAWPGDDVAPTFTVHLGAVPTDLLIEEEQHLEGVVRELTLARSAAGGHSLLPTVRALIETVTDDFADVRGALKRQAVDAADRGDQETELVLELPVAAADAGELYLSALAEADELSRSARLLSLETPPLHQVFRRWYVTSMVEQLRAHAAGVAVPAARAFSRVLADEVVSLSALRETADRLTLLQRVNGDLTGARTVQDIAAVVSRHATESLGAQAAMVFVVDGAVLRSVHAHGSDPRWVQRYQEVPLNADLPGAVVFNTGEPLLLRNLAQMIERWPILGQVYDSERVLHVVPLIVGDHRLGILSLSFPPGGRFDEETQVRFVRALADALAQAMQRAQSMEAAEAATQRLAFLADASVALTASLDVEQTVDAITNLLVPRLADWCSLVLVENGSFTVAGIAHTDPAKAPWAWDLVRAYPSRAEATHGYPAVLRTGVSELHPELSDAVLESVAIDAEHLRLLRGVGMRSVLLVPLPGRHGVIGVLTVTYSYESDRRYSQAEVAHVEDVARRAALALETARVLREQSGRLADVTRVAEAAQQAILAAPPARIGPVALAARYTSAAAEALVGGDLYETVARDGAVRLIVGDVRGKGLTAVRTATIVLGEFRASAADLDDLGDVARQIDRRVRAHLGDEDFVTALIAEIGDDGTFRIASCGHPPALLASGGRLRFLDTEPTLPLGLGADPTVLEGRLQVGDRLLLYTDGVLEARDADREFVDLEHLMRPLASGELESVLDDILEHLHAQVGSDLGDDLALLVAEYRG